MTVTRPPGRYAHAVERQRRLALQEAHTIRSRRARIKRLMSQGRITLEQIFVTDKQHLGTMPVREILLSVPGMGASKVNRVMSANKIGYGQKFENFSMQRRLELLDWIERRYPRVVVR